jgi:hypothetical protein
VAVVVVVPENSAVAVVAVVQEYNVVVVVVTPAVEEGCVAVVVTLEYIEILYRLQCGLHDFVLLTERQTLQLGAKCVGNHR